MTQHLQIMWSDLKLVSSFLFMQPEGFVAVKANGSSTLSSLVGVLDMGETTRSWNYSQDEQVIQLSQGRISPIWLIRSAPNQSHNFYSGHKVSYLAYQTTALKEL